MRICIVCYENECKEVMHATRNYFGDCDIEIIEPEQVPLKIKSCNIVVSKNAIVDFKGIAIKEKKENLYVCFKDMIFQTEADEELVIKRNACLKNNDLDIAKKINGVLLAIDFLLQREDSKGLPDYIQIETTNYCNAKCIMCSHYFSNNKGACHLSKETLNNMEDAIQLSSTISLNGMGEPFVSPNICEQIDYYKQLGNRIVTNTNLSVLNNRIIEQINSAFDWLEISIDGATSESYESIRKNLSFDILKNNLMKLKEECPHVRKHIATVIMRQNVHEMPELVELAHEFGADIITFMTLNSNIIIGNSEDEMSNYPRVLEYYSVKAIEKGIELGIPVIVPNASTLNTNLSYEDIRDELLAMDKREKFKSIEEEEEMCRIASVVEAYLQENDEIQYDTIPSKVKCKGICDWIFRHSYVDLHGNVAMCCRNQSFHIGNVNEAGNFSKVWNSDFYKKLRRIFYSGYIPEACLKCGLIESGNLQHLQVIKNADFYNEPAYKVRQKEILETLIIEEQNKK